jgi:hypothetical protein
VAERYFVELKITTKLEMSVFLPDDTALWDVELRVRQEIAKSTDPRIQNAKRVSITDIRKVEG